MAGNLFRLTTAHARTQCRALTPLSPPRVPAACGCGRRCADVLRRSVPRADARPMEARDRSSSGSRDSEGSSRPWRLQPLPSSHVRAEERRPVRAAGSSGRPAPGWSASRRTRPPSRTRRAPPVGGGAAPRRSACGWEVVTGFTCARRPGARCRPRGDVNCIRLPGPLCSKVSGRTCSATGRLALGAARRHPRWPLRPEAAERLARASSRPVSGHYAASTLRRAQAVAVPPVRMMRRSPKGLPRPLFTISATDS